MPKRPVHLLIALLIGNVLPLEAQHVNRWRPGFGVFAGVSAPAGSLGTIEGMKGNTTAGAIAGLTGSLATPHWEFMLSADRTFGSSFVADTCDQAGHCTPEQVDANLLTVLLAVGYRPIAERGFLLLGGVGVRHRLDAIGVNCDCRALQTFANPADALVVRGGARFEQTLHRLLVLFGDGSVDLTTFRAAIPEPGDRYNMYADFRLTAGLKIVRSRTTPTRPAQ